ncbi:four helix bundle protein [Gramella jeungdoensis]|uniref:Four helix bundle protein n=1 Tax=Gramella jeungdoensis TaxID=708091 RepID=A0ABT0Z374_9FLAO|nr:four helix bundle protein [Gramella jeungdoensis]MCM8569979.1 four helix bundle protein [Gramella jeungdoensis]
MRNLKDRTKQFAVDCWKFCAQLPHSREYNAYVNQLIRSSSSVGANYRAAQRAKSNADFINKLKIVEEEADESMYFLEILIEVLDNDVEKAKILHAECNEIISIIVSAINTTKRKINK